MSPLDVITLAEAKQFLRTDFADDDLLIEACIASSIALIERITQYRLYNRMEVENSDGTYNVSLFQYPLLSVIVTNLDNIPQPQFQIKIEPIRHTVIFERASYGNAWRSNFGFGDGLDNGVGYFTGMAASLPLYNINLNVGYTADRLGEIPPVLLQSAKTLIADMYENRGIAKEETITNITMQVSPYCRNPMF